jgi:hypothetical protein
MIMKQTLKNVINWVSTDGLLHFLICYVITMTFTPIIGWWTLLVAIIPALLKEGIDYYVRKSNTPKQVIHDLICDGAGIVVAYIMMLFWLIFYL